MKKVLVATCVVAMTAFGITNASADPMATARANAYGVDVGGSLLSGLVERTPEVTSTLPPGGREIADIITVPADPVAINGTGVVLAETSAESTIVPIMRDPSAPSPTPGGVGGVGDVGSITDTLTNLLGGGLGGLGGGGLPVGALQAGGDAGTVQAQQVPGVPGLPELPLIDELLGSGGTTPDGTLTADDVIDLPVANARGFARIDDATVVAENTAALGDLPPALLAVLVEGLLSVDVISAEAAVVCAGNVPVFDTAAGVVGLNNQNLDIVGDLLSTIGGIVPEDLVSIRVGETGLTADGTGYFVNALHVTVLGTPGTEAIPEVPAVPDATDPLTGELIPGTPAVPEVPAVPGVGQAGEPLLDIVLGHAEVSGTVCAPPAPPTSLVPTGDARPSLPRTGGLGVLPSVLGVGLLGGALTAGRVALRARRNGDSL